ncbi:MAG: monooxygenase [Streptosporangiales bacterium]|nr:monooxygenase [Streptosporangiales bacterium]
MGRNENSVTHRPVLVVGAGPVGMSAALDLRANGLAATVLEAEPQERVRPGSRAIFIHRESLQRLERTRPGLGREMAAHGLVWPTKRTFWRGRQVFVRDYPSPDPEALPPFTSLPQVVTERLLFDACKAADVEFVWEAQVTEVEATAEGVTLTTESGGSWAADYVIAADGARSAVRRAIGVPMEGSQSENSYVIVDVAEDPDDPRPPVRDFHYEHPALGGRNVLFVPFAGSWRVDLECLADDDPEVFSGPEGVRRWLPKVMDAKYADRVSWVSTYRFLQVLAEEFSDPSRRVLLVGEAAHLFAPFGARGLNSGIVDAEVAADAVRAATSTADPAAARAAIERFASERREAAEYNRAAAGLALAHMQGRDPVIRAKRRIAAALAPFSRRAGAWLDSAPYGPRSGARGRAADKY